MLSLLGDLLPYAVPVALSPLPLIAMFALLLAPAGLRGGVAFLAARIAVLALVALVVALLATGLATPDGPETERGGWLRIIAGFLLVGGSGLVWHGRPRAGTESRTPGWMASIDRATPAGAARLGAILTVANLKELSFGIGAGLILGGTGLPALTTLAGALVFAGIASLGTALPLVWLAVAGEDARAGLEAAGDWLRRNNSIVVAAVLVTVGALLIGSGLEAL